ncbi:MAG TPA: hypothetical protein VII95_18615 [Terriglobales bacterium]|jgi:hypothetical protein
MFEDSLVESSGTLSKRNPWTAALSFTMQGLLAVVLVLLPIIYTEALPGRQLTSILTEPGRFPGFGFHDLRSTVIFSHLSARIVHHYTTIRSGAARRGKRLRC